MIKELRTNKNVKKIINFYNTNSLSAHQICLKFGCSVQPIYSILKKNGINTFLKGKQKSKEHKIKISENAKINPNYGMKGKHLSQQAKDKIGLANKGRKRPDNAGPLNNRYNGGYRKVFCGNCNHTFFVSPYRIKNAKRNFCSKKCHMKYLSEYIRPYVIVPTKDTTIEVKIQNFLKQLGIEFFTHQYMKIEHGYQCDIFIPVQEGIIQKTIIECDGDFFHMNPKKFSPEDKIFKTGMTAKEKWELDGNRTQELIEKGFRVVRLWEHEIRPMKLNDFKGRLEYAS